MDQRMLIILVKINCIAFASNIKPTLITGILLALGISVNTLYIFNIFQLQLLLPKTHQNIEKAEALRTKYQTAYYN